MKKFLTLIVLIAIVASGYYYKDEIKTQIEKLQNSESQEKVLREKPKILRNFPPKEVEIFDLQKDTPLLTFTKSATTSSSKTAYILPQTSGKIEKLNVKVGDSVSKNDTLITLGNSLSTDIAELQYQIAQQNLELAKKTVQLTKKSSNETLSTTKLGVDAAKEAYENSLKAKENTEKLFQNQIESAELGIESAEDAYKNTKDNYNDILDTIDDMEDQLDDLEDQYDDLKNILPEDDQTLKDLKTAIAELEMAIEQTESQADSLKFAKENAKTGTEQAEIGLDQLKNSIDSQLDQLDFAINSMQTQYQSAQNQSQSAYTGTQLQELGLEGQILQATSALKSAKLNLEQKYIKAPIDGIITSLSVKEENFVSPGQVVLKIENNEKLSIKTSVNEEELELISLGDEVVIEKDSTTTTGEIISISPIANEMTKKIDIEIEIEDENEIKAGSFVKIRFSQTPKDSIFIPLNSIYIKGNSEKYVKVVKSNNTTSIIKVETGQIIDKYIEIRKGLTGTEKIIESSTAFIEEGEKIKIVN